MTHSELYDIVTRYTQTNKARQFCRANRIELDDAKHEIFVKLTSSDLAVIEKPANWVAFCGWRVLLDLAGKDRLLHYTDELGDVAAPSGGGPLSEKVLKVRHALDALPAAQRDALLAKARISTESCRAVAKRKRVTPQTVCNWANHAISTLQSALEDCP